LHRVGDPKISFDGKWVAYVVATPDTSADRNASNVWIVPTSGGMPLQLTQSGHDSSPEWSPDAKTLAFLSSREGTSQVYLLPMDGGEAHAVTHLSTGADLVKWSPDGKTIAFTSSVYPDCQDDDCNKTRDTEKEKNKVKAHVYEQLLYRHWTHWFEGKRSHIFVIAADGSGEPRDLNPEANYDVPPDERGGAADINFFAEFQGDLLHRGDRQDGGYQHERRFVCRSAGRRRAQAHHHESRFRWQSRIFAGRALHRLPRATHRWIRSGSLAGHALRPPERQK